jgi:hypothetical protein
VKTRSLYGFSADLPPFVDRTAEEQVAVLQSWGNTALFGGYRDPVFVDAVHRAGMRVYAEYGCFVGERWWKDVPESRPVTDEGKPLEADGWYYGVNPSVPRVRQERLEGLLTSYDIDGVWLDFIRWPCHWEVPQPYLPRTSFDAGTVGRFARDTGIDVAGDVDARIDLSGDDPVHAASTVSGQHADAWADWRCEQITSWVAAAKALIRRVRPGVILGLFGVPWRTSDHGGAIRTIIGQDYRALGARGVDVFSPMVYHRMCGHAPDWIGEVVQEIRDTSGKPVWPIIQSVDEPGPLPADEYARALEIALAHPASDGVLVFTMKGALAEDKLQATRAAFAPRGQ